MSTYKRPGSKQWWYRFNFGGQRIQASAKTTNRQAAKDIEAAARVRLAKRDAGIVEREDAPTLAAFADQFLAECRTRHGAARTERFYGQQVRYLLAWPKLAAAPLDTIDASMVAKFTARRRAATGRRGDPITIGTTNRQLATLRRMLRLAAEWGVIAAAPKIKLLPGEEPREYVLPRGAIETDYIDALPEQTGRIATFLVETALRVGEALTLTWRDVQPPRAGERGYLTVRGRNAKSRKPRSVPLTARAWGVIADHQGIGLIFPGAKLGTIDHHHAHARDRLKLPKEFVLHSLRHTALTRLGEAGADAFTIRAIAGHASILTSQRYVHPVPEALDRAVARAEALATVLATERAETASPEIRPRLVSRTKSAT